MLSGGFDLAVMRSGAGAAGKLVTDGGALITRMFGSEVPVVIACSGSRGRRRRAAAARRRRAHRRARRVPHRADRDRDRAGAAAVGGRARARASARPASSRSRPSAPRCTTPTARSAAGFLDAVVEPDALDASARSRRPRRWAKLPRGALPRPGADEPGRRARPARRRRSRPTAGGPSTCLRDRRPALVSGGSVVPFRHSSGLLLSGLLATLRERSCRS